jgi:hypothetical protein
MSTNANKIERVLNPLTNRMVKVGGDVYRMLVMTGTIQPPTSEPAPQPTHLNVPQEDSDIENNPPVEDIPNPTLRRTVSRRIPRISRKRPDPPPKKKGRKSRRSRRQPEPAKAPAPALEPAIEDSDNGGYYTDDPQVVITDVNIEQLDSESEIDFSDDE